MQVIFSPTYYLPCILFYTCIILTEQINFSQQAFCSSFRNSSSLSNPPFITGWQIHCRIRQVINNLLINSFFRSAWLIVFIGILNFSNQRYATVSSHQVKVKETTEKRACAMLLIFNCSSFNTSKLSNATLQNPIPL